MVCEPFILKKISNPAETVGFFNEIETTKYYLTGKKS